MKTPTQLHAIGAQWADEVIKQIIQDPELYMWDFRRDYNAQEKSLYKLWQSLGNKDFCQATSGLMERILEASQDNGIGQKLAKWLDYQYNSLAKPWFIVHMVEAGQFGDWLGALCAKDNILHWPVINSISQSIIADYKARSTAGYRALGQTERYWPGICQKIRPLNISDQNHHIDLIIEDQPHLNTDTLDDFVGCWLGYVRTVPSEKRANDMVGRLIKITGSLAQLAPASMDQAYLETQQQDPEIIEKIQHIIQNSPNFCEQTPGVAWWKVKILQPQTSTSQPRKKPAF